MKQRLKQFILSEREKIGHLSRRQAAAYIWDYYKIPIVGLACLLLLIMYLSAHFRSAVRDHWFYIMFADTRAEAGNGSALHEGYLRYTGFDTSEKAVDFNAEAWFDYTVNEARGNRYFELFAGLTDAGVLDAVTMEPDALTGIGKSGRLMDLTDERCRSIREKYGDRFLYSVPYNTEYSTEPVPIGIDVSDSILMTQYHMYESGCALGIGAFSENIDAAEKFLDYIFTDGAS